MNTRIDSRWPEIDALLDGVLDQPPGLRQAWLQAHCDDTELLALVVSLLDADSIRGAGIEEWVAAAHDRLEARAAELPTIPGYRVLRLIGEGGMASVFLAERVLGQTVQQVALKRLRLNVYDQDERSRFEHEHRILARLEHPNIARLVDAGIAPDGVPWFAMEYVEGEPLIAWCDTRKLSTDARLVLFADICAAIHHAHQHLVVHRDLKPSNILVDNDGRVKLLDFGIARLLDPDTGNNNDGTRTEQRRLTPGYAAPEQYTGHASTATDVYAMGVILVELLSGQRPATGSGSDPLRGLTVTAQDAGVRSSTPRALERLLSGDLGAIARKAMRSDPVLRYGSAQAFGEDLAALRSERPVAARRGDWRYRAACFIRRNKVAVAASILIAATLLAATAISLQQADRASAQAARAQAVQAFVEDMLAPLRDGVPQARMPKLDEVLAKGVKELDRSGGRDPAVYSELLVMLARTYDRMGDIATARTLAQRAYLHSADAFGSDDPRTVQALAMRGRMHARFGDHAQARKDLEAARAQMRRKGIDGEALAMVLDDLGFLQLDNEDATRAKQAMTLFEQAQQQRQRELGARHPDLAIGYANMAHAQYALANRTETLNLWQKAYQHCSTYEGPETRQAAIYLSRVGLTKCQLGHWRAGAHDYIAALRVFDQLDQSDHPERFKLFDGGCTAWVFLDELAQAQSDCDQAMAMSLRLYGEGSEMHNSARRNRINLLVAQGRLREARAEAGITRASLLSLPGVQPWMLQYLGWTLSDAQRIEGDYAGLRDAMLEIVREKNYTRWPSSPVTTARLALACAYAPDPACPGDLVATADAQMTGPAYPNHPMHIAALLALTQLALKQGDTAAADTRLAEIERLATLPYARLRPTHRWLAEARMLRGETLAAQGDRDGARREWRAAESVFAARYPSDHPFRRQLVARLHDVSPSPRPSVGQPSAH